MNLKEAINKNKTVFLVTFLQVLLVLMLAAIVVKTFFGDLLFYFIQIIFSIAFLKILFLDLKKETKNEHKYSVYFFAPFFAIIQLSWLIQPLLIGTNNLLVFFGFVIVVIIFIGLYRLLIGRNHTYGTILLSNEKIAVIKTDFDIRSFTTANRFIVDTHKKFPAGEKVKIVIKSGFFGRKKAKTI